ncbi:MAG: toxin-antitoxin system HicB family antitoxin [Clostridiaceae bacterium]|jgi:predicted HicB family RNase H-like nuclease|nr:toxin-antitoxin system HicB family antitoxin [Clostridiaceae bacterium]
MVSKTIRRTLRLKEELDKKVNEKAKELGISVNAFIVMTLTKVTK